MGTVRTIHFEYAEHVDEVAGLLQDPAYLRDRSERSGEYNVDIRVETRDDGVHVTVSREKNVELPAAIRAVVGSSNRAVERTLWRPGRDAWTAEYTIEVAGVPGKVVGSSTLAARGRGSSYRSTFEISVPIPLLGKRIEAAVADRLEEQLMTNAAYNADALKRGAQGPAHSYIAELVKNRSETR